MRELSLKIKSYTSNVHVIGTGLNRRVLNMMLFTLAVLSIGYLYLLGTMVVDIVARKGLETEARMLASEVSDLELEYLSLTNKVDINLAREMGFKEVKTQFTTRKSLGSVSASSNEL